MGHAITSDGRQGQTQEAAMSKDLERTNTGRRTRAGSLWPKGQLRDANTGRDDMANRRKLTKAERMAVYQKTNGHCAYCGCLINFSEMQADHVVPLHCGGEDTLDNLLPACRSCNHYKGTSTVESFRKKVEAMPGVLMRDSVTYKNAVRFGLVIPRPHRVKFYFEREEECEKSGNKSRANVLP